MDKKTLHHLNARLNRIRLWYLIVPLIVSGSICVMALRHNNLEMIALRDQVYQADKSGQNVEGALRNLRSYVYSHMNTDLATSSNVYPPIQLKYTYQRLLQAAQSKAEADNSLYTDAQKYCQQQDPTGFSGRGRVPCIESYVSTHGTSQVTIPSAMYEFDFVSPRWSPDLAGFSLLASILLALALLVRVGMGLVLKLLIRFQP